MSDAQCLALGRHYGCSCGLETETIAALRERAEKAEADARLLAEFIDSRYDGAPDAGVPMSGHVPEEVCAAIKRTLAGEEL
jgi:hypothetical protein